MSDASVSLSVRQTVSLLNWVGWSVVAELMDGVTTLVMGGSRSLAVSSHARQTKGHNLDEALPNSVVQDSMG